ncbi:UdgX family uracil-DNA binding protein [Yinghuangia sp. YIM S09857]|uniref:UdgX family uracil-DNA binding protein n=1 Tax=Yinghuangia sp. YIM S09857 TaxID=3436929 RepID=UPI003F538678
MAARFQGAGRYVPGDAHRTVDELRAAVEKCRGCDLYKDATTAVFGDGPPGASLMFVGEQPGDREDRAGEPFVGPAGRLLDRALAEADIERADVYVTNAVKHFRFHREGPGGRRLHRAPTLSQMTACRPWLEAEIDEVDPQVVVALGATAARSLFGRDFRLTEHRGEELSLPGGSRAAMATIHPSAVLRAPDRDAAFAGLVDDLRRLPGFGS